MKVCLYAADINLNRTEEKEHVEIHNFDLLGNKTAKTFFSSQMFYSPMDLFC